MRTVTWGAGCSLDGFIATPDDGVDRLHWSDDVQSLSHAYWATIDTVLMGRRTFEVAGSPYPGVRDVVFSRTLAATPGIEVVRDDAADFVHAQEGGCMYLHYHIA